MQRSFSLLTLIPLISGLLAACGGSSTTTGAGGSTSSTTVTTGATTSGTGGAGSGGGGAAPTFVEKSVAVTLGLQGNVLTITVKDGATPVLTDVWLYTFEDNALKPITAFQDPDSPRKHRGLMLPCTIDGESSGLLPCDKGELNGVMTGEVRDKIVGGKTEPDIDGTVAVTLDAPPTAPIVVIAAIEDQRYAGAGAIDASGKAIALPVDVGKPETHEVVTYTKDVQPIFAVRCVSCHSKDGMTSGFPLVTYEDVVSFNFAFGEEEEACEEQFPNDPAGLDACVKGITAVEYMVELGAPAVSPLARRTRPDEDKGASAIGLKWFGKSGARFGDHGDRRMPPSNTTADPGDDDPGKPNYFDNNPGEYRLIWSWIAQGCPE
ncbi:MAG: hypothetical protein U0359_20190 [Byssovorax sp.]